MRKYFVSFFYSNGFGSLTMEAPDEMTSESIVPLIDAISEAQGKNCVVLNWLPLERVEEGTVLK